MMKKVFIKKVVSILLATIMVLCNMGPTISIANAMVKTEKTEGFSSVSIGNDDTSGNVNFDYSSKTFNVSGSGLRIGKDIGVKDSYQFVSREVVGDATIIARLSDFNINASTDGQAGIIIRSDDKDEYADYMAVYVEPKRNTYRYSYRDISTDKAGSVNIKNSDKTALDASNKNLFIKIEKKSTNYKFYIAEDEEFKNVISSGSKSISSTDDKWNVGFVVSNGSTNNISTASYDNVKITDSTGVIYASNNVEDKSDDKEELPDDSKIEEELPDNSIEEYITEEDITEGKLPKGFLNSSIGNEENVYANYSEKTKEFTINGSGVYIGKDSGVTDNYQFVNYKLTGDVSITAYLSDYDMSNAIYGQTGVFIREDNTTNNANYFGLYVEPSKNTFRYAYRDNGIQRTGAANITASDKGYYLKVQKEGNYFRYYLSKDKEFKAENTFSGTQTIDTANDTWYVGFVVSNGGSASPAIAKFKDVVIENEKKVYFNSNLELALLDTVENLVATSSDKKVQLTWNEVEGATNYIVKRATEKDGQYNEIATVENTTYVDENVENYTTYYYKVIAKNEEGFSNDSKEVMAMPNNNNPDNLQYGKNATKFNMTEEPEDTVFEKRVRIKGSVNKDGKIVIKQNSVTVLSNDNISVNEEFYKDFNLNTGRNIIEIYHIDKDGKTTLKTYNIVYLKDGVYDIVVDKNYTGTNGDIVNNVKMYNNLTEAILSVDKKNSKRVTIFVKNGTYKEKLTIEAPYVSIIGENAQKTILTYDDANKTINPQTGTNYGTSKSASVTVKKNALGFTAENLTIENAFKEIGEINEQAVALNNQADQSIFVNCRFIGNQDTLLADAGSTSPARQYYYNCYIEGDVDFIFGRAQAVFDNCEILSLNRGSKTNNGYVTAADTWDKDAYGYLIINSRLLSQEGTADKTVSIGRPWRPSNSTQVVTPSVAYVNTYMDSHITDKGWDDMGTNSLASTSRFNEFASFGPGAKITDTRNNLTANQAKEYTIEKVFAKNSASKEVLRLFGKAIYMPAYSNDWNPNASTQKINKNTLYQTVPGEQVSVIIPAESISLDINDLQLKIGETNKLLVTINPSNATEKDVIFTSSDENIATVDENGNVIAVNSGTAIITAKLGELEANCTVNVLKNITVLNTIPEINAEDIVIKLGDTFNAMSNVKAFDKEDGDLTHLIEILENTVDINNVGEYKVVYKVSDFNGASAIKTIKVTVEKVEENLPEDDEDLPEVDGEESEDDKEELPETGGEESEDDKEELPEVGGEESEDDKEDLPEVGGEESEDNKEELPEAGGEESEDDKEELPETGGEESEDDKENLPETGGEESEDDKENSESPQTGDKGIMPMLVTILVAGMIIYLVNIRKRQYN